MSAVRDELALDGRRAPELRGELAALVRAYVPDWPMDPDAREPGAALVNAFAHLTEVLVARLDRASERRGMACLSELGASLVPARQALVPVQFALAPGASEPVLVPAGTEVSAQGEEGPIVFQTREDLLVHPGGVKALVGVDPFTDRICRPPAGFLEGVPTPQDLVYRVRSFVAAQSEQIVLEHATGLALGHHLRLGGGQGQLVRITYEPKDGVVRVAPKLEKDLEAGAEVIRVTTFAPFDGVDEQEHVWYIGDDNLLKIETPTLVTIKARREGSLGDRSVVWEAWAEDEEVEAAWIPLAVEEARDPLADLRLRVEQKLAKTTVDGKESFWLRCRLGEKLVGDPPPTTNSLVRLSEVKLTLALADRDEDSLTQGPSAKKGADEPSIPPSRLIAIVTEVPLPRNGAPIRPFGYTPRVLDCFYVASDEVFSKRETKATLVLSLTAFLKAHADKEPDADGTESGTSSNVPCPSESGEVFLALEYWNGSSWLILTHGETLAGSIKVELQAESKEEELDFEIPRDIQPTAVLGQQGWWVRLRILGGKLHSTRTQKPTGEVITEATAITLGSLSLRYSLSDPRAAGLVRTYNNLLFKDPAASGVSGQGFAPFEAMEVSGRSLYLGFEAQGALAGCLFGRCTEWEARRTAFAWKMLSRGEWVPLSVEDGSADWTRSGVVKLSASDLSALETRFGAAAHWIRAEEQGADEAYRNSPSPRIELLAVYPNTTWAEQARTVREELFGSSNGEPHQEVSLHNPSVVGTPRLFVREIAGEAELQAIDTEHVRWRLGEDGREAAWIEWELVEDLSACPAGARAYELDRARGLVRFGDGLHGGIPPLGVRNLLALEYRVGGGVAGNVPKESVTTLATAVAGIAKVSNPLEGGGGADVGTPERSTSLACERLAHGRRAVTTEDYERLALAEDALLVRARCLVDPESPREDGERWIRVAVLVRGSLEERMPPTNLALREALAERLRATCHGELVRGVRLDVVAPLFVEVEVRAVLRVGSVADAARVERAAERALQEFLHPVLGGRARDGWDFGRRPHDSDVLALLARVSGVRGVDELELRRADGGSLPARFGPRDLVASARRHLLEVRVLEEEGA